MPSKIHTATKPEPPRKCVECGHFETEHGKTGTHPCLAVVGDLAHRNFCPCNAFRPSLPKAA